VRADDDHTRAALGALQGGHDVVLQALLLLPGDGKGMVPHGQASTRDGAVGHKRVIDVLAGSADAAPGVGLRGVYEASLEAVEHPGMLHQALGVHLLEQDVKTGVDRRFGLDAARQLDRHLGADPDGRLRRAGRQAGRHGRRGGAAQVTGQAAEDQQEWRCQQQRQPARQDGKRLCDFHGADCSDKRPAIARSTRLHPRKGWDARTAGNLHAPGRGRTPPGNYTRIH